MTKKMNSSQSLLDAIASLRSHILCHKLKTVMYSRLSYCQGCQTVNRICNTHLYLSSCRVHEYSSTFLCFSCTQRILVVTILFPFSTSRSLQVEHVSSKCTWQSSLSEDLLGRGDGIYAVDDGLPHLQPPSKLLDPLPGVVGIGSNLGPSGWTYISSTRVTRSMFWGRAAVVATGTLHRHDCAWVGAAPGSPSPRGTKTFRQGAITIVVIKMSKFWQTSNIRSACD